jgi:hypothetical protein
MAYHRAGGRIQLKKSKGWKSQRRKNMFGATENKPGTNGLAGLKPGASIRLKTKQGFLT